MEDPPPFNPAGSSQDNSARDELDTVPTSPADIASAGRSCMAIVVLAAVIVLVLLVWIGYRSFGGQ